MKYRIIAKITAAILSAAGLAAGLASCSDGDADRSFSPKMVETTPSDGSSAVNPGDLEVKIIFDDNVTLSPTGFSKVGIEDASVTRVSPVGEVLTIYLSGLQRGKRYTLHVGQGTVLGSTGVGNEPVSISFTTLEAPGKDTVAPQPCTENASEAARKVYDLLRNAYGNSILSSTMANVSWNINEAELVKKEIGSYPAIAFFDYIHLHYSPTGWIDYNRTDVVENWWNSGGIPGACWHWRVPKDENDNNPDNFTYRPEETTFRPKNILVEGTWENKVAEADLNEMADYLLLLQEKGIPLIWRPLHEAAGNTFRGGAAWFWWGIDGGETYIKLWRHMFDFFKNKGVRNLIWVWTTETGDNEFYPGDEYVDIIGRDLYQMTDAAKTGAEYEAILKEYPGKMIALSECGGVAPISEQWAAGARWVFFMPWYEHDTTTLQGHGSADTAWWTDAFSQGYVLRRDNLKLK